MTLSLSFYRLCAADRRHHPGFRPVRTGIGDATANLARPAAIVTRNPSVRALLGDGITSETKRPVTPHSAANSNTPTASASPAGRSAARRRWRWVFRLDGPPRRHRPRRPPPRRPCRHRRRRRVRTLVRRSACARHPGAHRRADRGRRPFAGSPVLLPAVAAPPPGRRLPDSGAPVALVVDAAAPDPARDAASVALLSHMHALPRLGFFVVFATLAEADDAIRRMAGAGAARLSAPAPADGASRRAGARRQPGRARPLRRRQPSTCAGEREAAVLGTTPPPGLRDAELRRHERPMRC